MEQFRKFEITVKHAEHETELVRTLTTLFGTRSGSQPADREFGISWECLDDVPEVSENLFYLEAVRKVGRYEPRVQISDMTFYPEPGGSMSVHIFFTGKE